MVKSLDAVKIMQRLYCTKGKMWTNFHEQKVCFIGANKQHKHKNKNSYLFWYFPHRESPWICAQAYVHMLSKTLWVCFSTSSPPSMRIMPWLCFVIKKICTVNTFFFADLIIRTGSTRYVQVHVLLFCSSIMLSTQSGLTVCGVMSVKDVDLLLCGKKRIHKECQNCSQRLAQDWIAHNAWSHEHGTDFNASIIDKGNYGNWKMSGVLAYHINSQCRQ